MAIVNTVSCDECGAVRGEANHWFRALVFTFSGGRKFIIQEWQVELTPPSGDTELHLCSEQCAAKAMSKAIGAGK